MSPRQGPYLPTAAADGPLPPTLLERPDAALRELTRGLSERDRASVVSALRADQAQRWSRGEPLLVEAYLEQWPPLADDPEGVAELLDAEAGLRLARGETPTLQEYLGRFPRCETPLRKRFALRRLL